MRRQRKDLRFSAASLLVAVFAATAGAEAASTPWASSDVSQVRLISATEAVGEAESLRLGLHFRLDPGWKIYWRSPGDSGSPPMVGFAGSRNLADAALSWPAPLRFHEAADLETVGYRDEVVLPLDVRPERPGEAVDLRLRVDYQACEIVCIPMTADLALSLPAGAATASPFVQLIDRYAARVPGVAAAAGIEVTVAGVVGAPPAQRLVVIARAPVPFVAPELFVEASSRYRVRASTVLLSGDGGEARLEAAIEARGDRDLVGEDVILTLVDGERALELALTMAAIAVPPAPSVTAGLTLLPILALALLGGLILNLMPCVLPVLSLKILGAIGHGGGERRRVTLGFLASAAGIVASFLLLAAGVVAVKLAGGVVGWGIQFQQPLFLVFVVLVISLFAYNLAGVYELRLPGWLGDAGLAAGERAHGTGSLAGNFVTGGFATLLATPCTAPFLGTAVGFALARGASEIFAVFAALGLGMSAPYLLVAAFPRLATSLPRPGRWMVRLRRVLALALAATALWLLSVLAAVSGPAVAAAVAALTLAIGGLLWLPHARPGLRATALAGLAVLVALSFTAPTWLATAGGGDGGQMAAGELDWQPFDIAAIAESVAAGKVVFVDVTADWCVTCQVNKRLVIRDAAVRARLEAPGVVCMRADWTRPSDEIAAYLASFGRYGIPFNAVYGPARRDGIVLPELLSKDAVLDALAAAGLAT